jgi:hypothetical protein
MMRKARRGIDLSGILYHSQRKMYTFLRFPYVLATFSLRLISILGLSADESGRICRSPSWAALLFVLCCFWLLGQVQSRG